MKRIIVTGATGGIGEKLCHLLDKKGCYQICLLGRNEEKLKTLQYELTGKHVYHKFDFCDKNSRYEFQTYCKDQFESIDGLVLMPPQIPASLQVLPDENEWEDMFSHSFISPLMFLKSMIPFLEKANRSKVVLTSGISSVNVMPNYGLLNEIL